MSDSNPDTDVEKPPFDFTFDRTTGIDVRPGSIRYYANGVQVDREDYLAIIQTHAFTGADLYAAIDDLMDRLGELAFKVAAQAGYVGAKA